MKRIYLYLHLLLLFYACGSIFSKSAAEKPFLSAAYLVDYGIVLLILMVYAFFWQKVLKRIPLNVAMANKAATVIWGIILGALVFKERITVCNILGAIIIIVGIILVVNADKESGSCT